MKSKFIFEDHAEQIKEEHELYESHQENTEIIKARCDHKNKVKIVNNELRCDCGASWGGSQIETLYKMFTD